MSGVSVTNLPQFDAQVEAWFAGVNDAAADAAVVLAREAFDTLLEISPQFSGDFVANWVVSTDGAMPPFKQNALSRENLFGSHKGSDGLLGFEPLGKGSPEAINYAKQHAVWPKVALGTDLYLSNSAMHYADDGTLDLYAVKIEKGEIDLRPINEGASHVVRRTVLEIGFKYQNIHQVQLDHLGKVGL